MLKSTRRPRPKCLVDYEKPSTSPRECFREKKCVIRNSVSLSLEPWSFIDGSWRHWNCISPLMLKQLKIRTPSPADLSGFDSLLRGDRIRIAQDMGWNISAITSQETLDNSNNSTQPTLPKQSTSNLRPKTLEESPTLKSGISAQNLGGSTKDRMGSLDIRPGLKPRNSVFEPIIYVPDTPLPSLDFRPRKSGADGILTNGTTVTSKIEATGTREDIKGYKENPLSIVGKRFLFVDTNEIWEVSEITFGKKGWGMVVIESEKKDHKIDFGVLLSMLKHGVLDVIRGEKA